MGQTVAVSVGRTKEETAALSADRALSPSEIELFFSALDDPRYQALAALCLYCGLSTGEALAMKVSDVDIQGRQQLAVKGKRDRSRSVPLSSEALPYLQPALSDRTAAEPLFPGPAGRPLTSRAVQRNFEAAGKKAGLPPGVMTPNNLRRTFATIRMHETSDVHLVAGIMGIRPEGLPRLVDPAEPRISKPVSEKQLKLRARTGAHRGGAPRINAKRDQRWWSEFYEQGRTYKEIADRASAERSAVAKAVAAEQHRRVKSKDEGAAVILA